MAFNAFNACLDVEAVVNIGIILLELYASANSECANIESDLVARANLGQVAADAYSNAIAILRRFANIEDFGQREQTLLKQLADAAKKAAFLWKICLDHIDYDMMKKSYCLSKIVMAWRQCLNPQFSMKEDLRLQLK